MKSLHNAVAALGAVFLSLSVPQSVQAQSTFRTPVVDGIISDGEYDNEYRSTSNDDPNLLWRMTWDDENLYIAIEDANLQQKANLYLDTDPQTPVNTPGGNQQSGRFEFGMNGKLPIQADVFISVDKFHREFSIYNRETRQWGPAREWGKPTDRDVSKHIGQYADNATGEETSEEEFCDKENRPPSDDDKWSECEPETNFSGTIKEFALPWALISTTGARPKNFNWFGHIIFGFDPIDDDTPNEFRGGIYGMAPRGNESSFRYTADNLYQDYNWTRYFTVLNTDAGSATTAFGPNNSLYSYAHTGPDAVELAGINVYDFTLNTANTTITRSVGDATWNIQGSLVVGDGSTLNLSQSASSITINQNLRIGESGTFIFNNTAGSLGVRGDIVFTKPTSFQTTAGVALTGTGNQTISGGTYRALTVQDIGIKTLTDRDLLITSSLTLTNGTLATGANKVILEGPATFSETSGYLLGSIETTRNLTATNAENFGGIGLTITPTTGVSNIIAQRITGGFGIDGTTNQNKTIRRRFSLTATGSPTVNSTMAFTYRDANPSELEGNLPANLALYKSANQTGPYAQVATASAGSTSTTKTFSTDLAFDGSFYSLSSANAPLPVELISFTGKAENNVVRLNWATASELQNKGFEIQHRTDLSEWKNIGFVAGKGTTNQRQNYAYLDRLAVAGVNNYYRLRQIDVDGKSVYSQPVTVQLRGTGSVAFSVSPVPATDVLTLNGLSAGNHVAEIYNARGQRVMRQEFNESTPATLSVRALPVGVYMVRVLGANRSVQNARFIKQ